MRKAEDGETKEGKHTCLWREKSKNSVKDKGLYMILKSIQQGI